jgi:hypothetical protein
MNTKISVTIGSIIGACVLHFALASCSGNGNADASTDCASWSTAYYAYDIPITGGEPTDVPVNQVIGSTPMPAGWEPIAFTWIGGDSSHLRTLATIRQCSM